MRTTSTGEAAEAIEGTELIEENETSKGIELMKLSGTPKRTGLDESEETDLNGIAGPPEAAGTAKKTGRAPVFLEGTEIWRYKQTGIHESRAVSRNASPIELAAAANGISAQELHEHLSERLNEMWVIDDVRGLETDMIVDRLRSLGFEIDHDQMASVVEAHASAEELFFDLESRMPHPPEGEDEDFAILSLIVLWERWFPDVANAEMIDDSMQRGYDLLETWNRDDLAGLERGVEEWARTWSLVKEVASRFGMQSVQEFDDQFAGLQSLFNWSQDFDMELENALTFRVPHLGRAQYHAEFDRTFPLSAGHPQPRIDDSELGSLALEQGASAQPNPQRKIGRNEPCPCGSGKKYKRCCGR